MQMVHYTICFQVSYSFIFRTGDKSQEIDKGQVDQQTIHPGKDFTFNACGRFLSPSGTEGSFELLEVEGELVRKIYWDCPYGLKRNIIQITENDENWVVSPTGYTLSSGALGNGSFDCVYVPEVSSPPYFQHCGLLKFIYIFIRSDSVFFL